MTDFSAAYLQGRESDPELDSMLEQTRQAEADGKATELLEAAETQKAPKGPPTRGGPAVSPNPYMRMVAGQQLELQGMSRIGKDAMVGVYDAVRNVGETALDVAVALGSGEVQNPAIEGDQTPEIDLADVSPDFVREADAMRNKLAAGGNEADVVLQKGVQFTVPFMAAIREAGKVTVAKTIAIDAATNYAVWDPHEARFADLLREIAPDNRLTNVVLDYLGSDPEDTAAEGRFKNALDGLMATGLIGASFLGVKGFVETAAGTIKYAKSGGFKGPLSRSPAAQRGAITFHGSPHEFDKFDMSKIGTGEGAQAYGHGLYFAESKGVAGTYKARIGDNPTKYISKKSGEVIEAGADGYEKLVAQQRRMALNGQSDEFAKRYSFETPGSLYHVDIPDEHIAKMLDWDKPLSEQAPEVRKALQSQFRIVKELDSDGPWVAYFGEQSLDSAKTQKALIAKFESSPAAMLTAEGGRGRGERKATSDLLKTLGIPGIKYYDGGSRAAGEGTRNIVLFDERLAKILKRE